MDRDFPFAAEIRASAWFAPPVESHVDWQRPMTRDEFLGMSVSTTYISRAIEASSQTAIEAEVDVCCRWPAGQHSTWRWAATQGG